jgi:phage replication O-like protein O
MANPQPDQFTRISNELMVHLPKYKFNGTQLRIVLVLIRYTYGFSRKECELSLTYLAKATGINKEQVKRELDKLIKLNVVLVTKETDFHHSRELSFNKNYDTWVKIETKPRGKQGSKKLTVSGKDHCEGSKKLTLGVSKLDHQERNSFKESIKETTKGKEAEDVTELIHYQKIIDSYNSICTGLPKAIKATENRKTHIRARWVQFSGSIEFFESYFREVSQSAFLNGNNNRRWKADFDWLFNEANMVKVLEGKYSKKTGGNGSDLADKQMEQLVKMGEKV